MAALLLSSSCGESPTEGGGGRVRVFVGISGAPFSALIEGQTVTADGVFAFEMAPGRHEISGTFASGFIVLVFSGGISEDGGVQSGSLRSLAGNQPQVFSCGASWGDFFSQGVQSFRVEFTVTRDRFAACQ